MRQPFAGALHGVDRAFSRIQLPLRQEIVGTLKESLRLRCETALVGQLRARRVQAIPVPTPVAASAAETWHAAGRDRGRTIRRIARFG